MNIPENTNTQVDELSNKAPNPWLSMWIRPRETIRHIVSTNPERHVLLIAALSGIYQVLDNAADRSVGDQIPFITILGIALVLGSLGGIFRLAIESWLLSSVGNWFGGQSNFKEIGAAVAWSSLPSIVYLIIFVPILVIFGGSWFTSDPGGISMLGAIVFVAILIIIGIVGVLWRAFMLISSVAELHAFSVWRAIATILVGYAIPIIPILCLLFATEFLRG